MRTGSSTNTTARSTGKTVSWTMYARKTTSLSTALSSGTWTDVTGRVTFDSLPDVSQKIEFGTGQFTVDEYSFSAMGVVWWKANLLNVSSTEFLEVKVLATLGGVSYNMFCGFVDVNRDGYSPQERTDTINLTARTVEDLGSRMPGELLSTQYIDSHINGGSTVGLVLQNITGMYVTNANVASFVLQVGTHTIAYDYNGGTRRAKLDSGAYVTLSAGSNTLGNVDNTSNDTQRVTIYTPTLASLSSSGVLTEEIVVVTAGTTYPNVWYRNISAKYVLNLAYTQLGITSTTFDTMEIGSWDGGARYQVVDAPVADGQLYDQTGAMCSVGNDLYLGVGNKLYKRTYASETYTLIRTLTAGRVINKIQYNSRQGHLWIMCDAAGSLATQTTYLLTYLYRWTIATDKLSAELSLSGKGARTYCAEVYDYNYTGSSYKYSLVYGAATTNEIREVLGSAPDVEGQALTDSLIFAGATVSGTILADFLYIYTSGSFRIVIIDSVAPNHRMYNDVGINSGGTWINNGHRLDPTEQYNVATYNSADDRVYYFRSNPSLSLNSHTSASTTVTTLSALGASDSIDSMFTASNNRSYFSRTTTVDSYLYGIVSNAVTGILQTGCYVRHFGFSYTNSRLYGITSQSTTGLRGQLFQYGSAGLIFQVPIASFKDVSVKDAIYKLCRGFNLLPIISSDKGARVYRRGNSSGTPQTSGNSISVSMSDASDLEEVINAFPPFDLVRIIGQTLTTTYNGTAFDANVLSTKDVLEINSPYIPDVIVKDIAYYVYQFFKTKRTLYRVKLGSTPLFQYEPFDGCTVTFTGKIAQTGSGVIYGATYSPNGDMAMEVLI